MEVNTPGESDGAMAFWVNDDLAYEVGDMYWRDIPELQLNDANLGHYIEVGDADQSNRLWWDDMVVSTERIGCSMSLPPETTTGPGSGTGDASTGDPIPTTGGDESGVATSVPGSGGPTGAGQVPAEDSSSDGGCACRSGSSTGAYLLWIPLLALWRRRRRGARVS